MATSNSFDETRPTDAPAAVRWLVITWLGVALMQATVVTRADLLNWLGFDPNRLGHAWWTLLSYGAVHDGTWPLVVSLFTLLALGPRLERTWGTKTFVLYFLWCTAGGSLAHAVFVHAGTLDGPAAGLFGLMLAYAWQWPNEELFLFGVMPIRIWTLNCMLAGAMLALGVSGDSVSGWGYLAQLGGFVFGALYLRRPTPVSIEELRHRVAAAPDPTDEAPRAIPRSMPRTKRADEVDEIVAQSRAAVAKQVAPAVRATAPRDSKREALNRVLDKISEQGLDSLSAEDRRLLEEMSRRLRGR